MRAWQREAIASLSEIVRSFCGQLRPHSVDPEKIVRRLLVRALVDEWQFSFLRMQELGLKGFGEWVAIQKAYEESHLPNMEPLYAELVLRLRAVPEWK